MPKKKPKPEKRLNLRSKGNEITKPTKTLSKARHVKEEAGNRKEIESNTQKKKSYDLGPEIESPAFLKARHAKEEAENRKDIESNTQKKKSYDLGPEIESPAFLKARHAKEEAENHKDIESNTQKKKSYDLGPEIESPAFLKARHAKDEAEKYREIRSDKQREKRKRIINEDIVKEDRKKVRIGDTNIKDTHRELELQREKEKRNLEIEIEKEREKINRELELERKEKERIYVENRQKELEMERMIAIQKELEMERQRDYEKKEIEKELERQREIEIINRQREIERGMEIESMNMIANLSEIELRHRQNQYPNTILDTKYKEENKKKNKKNYFSNFRRNWLVGLTIGFFLLCFGTILYKYEYKKPLFCDSLPYTEANEDLIKRKCIPCSENGVCRNGIMTCNRFYINQDDQCIDDPEIVLLSYSLLYSADRELSYLAGSVECKETNLTKFVTTLSLRAFLRKIDTFRIEPLDKFERAFTRMENIITNNDNPSYIIIHQSNDSYSDSNNSRVILKNDTNQNKQRKMYYSSRIWKSWSCLFRQFLISSWYYLLLLLLFIYIIIRVYLFYRARTLLKIRDVIRRQEVDSLTDYVKNFLFENRLESNFPADHIRQKLIDERIIKESDSILWDLVSKRIRDDIRIAKTTAISGIAGQKPHWQWKSPLPYRRTSNVGVVLPGIRTGRTITSDRLLSGVSQPYNTCRYQNNIENKFQIPPSVYPSTSNTTPILSNTHYHISPPLPPLSEYIPKQ